MEPIAAVCDILVDPHDPRAQNTEYQIRLRSLEGALISNAMPKTTVIESDMGEDIIAELYQLATLVYLCNGSASPYLRDPQLDASIDRAFYHFRKLNKYERTFPLVILGSEARNDEERALLLELIHRTETKVNGSNTIRMKTGLAMMWSQRDLEADEDEYSDQSYLHRLDTVISSACTLPLFS